MLRIDLATGEVVRTATPTLESHSTMVAGDDWVVTKAVTGSEGSVVRTGSRATPVPAALRVDGWLNRGPGEGIWLVPEQPAYPVPASGVVRLVTLDGRVDATRSIVVDPRVGAPLHGDGYGGLLVTTRTGIYQIHPSASARTGRVRLVTRGALLGLGGRRLLTWDCDARARCGVYRVDQRSSRRTLLPTAAKALTTAAGGVIEELIDSDNQLSPDGNHLALTTLRGTGTRQIQVIDLTTGRAHPIPGIVTDSNPNRQLAWTPNSRWLLGLTDHRLQAFDTRTHTRHTLAVTGDQLLHVTGPRTPGP
jgi:hypothetical protein